MPIKHSFSILFSNLKLVSKIFIFFLIILIIAGAILIGIVKPVLNEFFDALRSDVGVTGQYFYEHPILSLQKFADYFSHFVSNNSAEIDIKIVYIWVLVIVSRFLLTLPIMPVTKILYDKMTSGFDMGLLNATVTTIAQNVLYSALTAIFVGTFDLAMTFGACVFFVWAFRHAGLIILPVLLLAYLVLGTARLCIFSQWLPELCASSSKNIFKALAVSFKPAFKKFVKNFLCLFFLLIATYTLVSVSFIPTVGLVPIFTLPLFVTMYSAMTLTLNFSYHQRKYFIDNGVTIFNPVKKY